MSEKPTVSKSWLVPMEDADLQIRCFMERSGNTIARFTAQLELLVDGEWQPVVRYDNAHGFCHRDVLHADGSQDKEPVSIQDTAEAFTFANRDLRDNQAACKARFLKETRP